MDAHTHTGGSCIGDGASATLGSPGCSPLEKTEQTSCPSPCMTESSELELPVPISPQFCAANELFLAPSAKAWKSCFSMSLSSVIYSEDAIGEFVVQTLQDSLDRNYEQIGTILEERHMVALTRLDQDERALRALHEANQRPARRNNIRPHSSLVIAGHNSGQVEVEQ